MSTGVVLLRLFAALGLVALNGFFVSVEFAVVAVRRTRLDQMSTHGSAIARMALRLVNDPDRVIAASQLGITIASLALGWVGEATVAALIEPAMVSLVGRWSETAAHSLGTVVAFSLVTLVHIVLGEQVPKTLAIRYAERATLFVSRPVTWFIRIFRPLISVLDGATSLVLHLIGMQPIAGHHGVYSLEELRLLVRESQEGGALEAHQEEMLQKVLALGDRQVHEAMIPRPDVVGIESKATVQDLLTLFSQASHARFPVSQGDLDHIMGIVAIKDVLRALAEDPDHYHTPVSVLTRPAQFVPETVAVADLMTEMRASHNQMAIVIDEFGGTAGIVTLEELVEEIVGRLSDELAPTDEPVVRVNEQTVEVDAQLRIDELNGQLGVNLPEGEHYETIAGLILYSLQRVPKEGATLQHDSLELQVLTMTGPKIDKVRITQVI